MSAYIVDKEHIDAMLHAGLMYGKQYPVRFPIAGDWDNTLELNVETVHKIGKMLWMENARSVSSRYPNDKPGTWPGPAGLTLDDVLSYHYQATRAITPIEGLKLIHYYRYQTCEHEGFETSDAAAFCKELEALLIRKIPGYEEAPWGWQEAQTV